MRASVWKACVLHCLHNTELLVTRLVFGKATLCPSNNILAVTVLLLAEVTRNKHGCMFQIALNSSGLGVRGMEC